MAPSRDRKAATRGNRGEVSDAFDRRKGAKAAAPANEDAGGEDMFARAGIAAE